MIDKIKKIFSNKEKRIENLVSLLIILVITLIIINNIIDEDSSKSESITTIENKSDAYLADNMLEDKSSDLEKRLENILETIDGISSVSAMLTYSESSQIIPVYNINQNEEGEEINVEKEVILDKEQNVITEKVINPKLEGAIITAKGVSNPVNKGNVISAVEAVTGLSTHKIQVFEMGEN